MWRWRRKRRDRLLGTGREWRAANAFCLDAYMVRLIEIKRRAKPTDPFPLYGGRLGWGCAAR